MNEESIVKAYTHELKTLRQIAQENGTDHHKIKRILEKHGVELDNARRKAEGKK